MTDFVNQRFFDKDYALQKAMGRDLKRHFTALETGGDAPGLEGGIVSPERVELPIGAIIVRFGQHGHAISTIAGEWWLRWQDYLPLEQLADLKGWPVRDVVAYKCVIPPEWSDMAFVVQARVTAPLLAYGGTGRPAASAAHGKMTGSELGGGPAFQLFIPGLGNGDIRHDALAVLGYAFLDPASTRRGFINRVPG